MHAWLKTCSTTSHKSQVHVMRNLERKRRGWPKGFQQGWSTFPIRKQKGRKNKSKSRQGGRTTKSGVMQIRNVVLMKLSSRSVSLVQRAKKVSNCVLNITIECLLLSPRKHELTLRLFWWLKSSLNMFVMGNCIYRLYVYLRKLLVLECLWWKIGFNHLVVLCAAVLWWTAY